MNPLLKLCSGNNKSRERIHDSVAMLQKEFVSTFDCISSDTFLTKP
jgi:hypothetical protein